MANVLTPAGGIFRRWFVLEKAVARRIDDRTAKRMMRAAGWREDLMYALREEGDMGLFVPIFDDVRFLSTPSARRATAKTEKNISAFVSL